MSNANSTANLVSDLKAVHKTPFTQLAKSIEAASTIRRRGPGTNHMSEEEFHLPIGHGYSIGQQRIGSHKSALRRNRTALKKSFTACVPHMQKRGWNALLRDVIETIARYGIPRQELEAEIRNEDGLTKEEEMLWELYVGNRKRFFQITTPV